MMTAPPLRVGQLATVDAEPILRRVTSVTRDRSLPSGWAVSLDGGEGCPTCGQSAAPLYHRDAGQLRPVVAVVRGRADAARVAAEADVSRRRGPATPGTPAPRRRR